MKELKKKNSLIIFLDFDGVLHPFFPRGSYFEEFEENAVRILGYS